MTVPFSARFDDLSSLQRDAYLVVLSGAIVSTALMLAPVAFHRILFRHGQRRWLVETANQMARVGLAFVGLTTAGVAFLVFDIVIGLTGGVLAGMVALAVFIGLWVGIPIWRRN